MRISLPGATRAATPWALALALQVSPGLAQSVNDAAAHGADCQPRDAIAFRGGTARLENDLFANTDQNYTNGVAFTAVSHDIAGPVRVACLPAPVRLHARLIRFLDPGFWEEEPGSTATQNVVVKFGQSLYTPRDPARTDLVRDDRPYAGLLYVGMSWNRRTHDARQNTEMLDTREITLGVIGPMALGRQTQNLVHDAIGADRFLGWDNQLKNEPALQLALDRKYRDHRSDGAIVPGFSADTIRSLGLRLGPIETSASVGVEGRIGWNLPNDFGSYPIRPGAENRPPSAASPRNRDRAPQFAPVRPGAHVFGMLEAKLVARDFSLDGNLLRSSHSVTRRPLVAQAALGVSVHGLLAGHGVRLAVMRVWRTREFKEQQSGHAYGSVALSIEF